MPLVAPSLLAANFLKLEDECKMLNESQADWFHLDIMDGRFVPNITIGPFIVEAVRKATALPLDVHLMIVEPGETRTLDHGSNGRNTGGNGNGNGENIVDQ